MAASRAGESRRRTPLVSSLITPPGCSSDQQPPLWATWPLHNCPPSKWPERLKRRSEHESVLWWRVLTSVKKEGPGSEEGASSRPFKWAACCQWDQSGESCWHVFRGRNKWRHEDNLHAWPAGRGVGVRLERRERERERESAAASYHSIIGFISKSFPTFVLLFMFFLS